jgi:hypothetical protein
LAVADPTIPKVMGMASNSVGKTMVCGGLVNWFYETHNPGICLTTAPTDTQVVDLLWKEVRAQAPSGLPLLPKAPAIEDPDSPMHYAKGYVARDSNSFQGRHEENLFLIFDEAIGVRAEFWVAGEAMLTSGAGNKWLAIFNPTDIASLAYQAYGSGEWYIVQISSLEHPNIEAELAHPGVQDFLARTPLIQGTSLKPLTQLLQSCNRPYPKAVSLEWVSARVREWCSPIDPSEANALSLEWPPASNVWYKPGPLFEARVMGRWPSSTIDSVWSATLVEQIFAEISDSEINSRMRDRLPEIGCDVARFGDDLTAIHVQCGGISLYHESHNGWSTTETAGRCKQLANQYGQLSGTEGRFVPVKIDDDGVGGGVTDQAEDYSFIGCSGARACTSLNAIGEPKYPNGRSEAWFSVVDRALDGQINCSRLDPESRHELRRQLLSPLWKLDAKGRQVVERKSDTKRRLGRSPDDADAFNLAHSASSNEGLNVVEFYRDYFFKKPA